MAYTLYSVPGRQVIGGLLTAEEHDARDHAPLASVLSPAEHAALDHTGIPGVGSGGTPVQGDFNGTTLTFDGTTDGQYLKRVGTSITTATPPTGSGGQWIKASDLGIAIANSRAANDAAWAAMLTAYPLGLWLQLDQQGDYLVTNPGIRSGMRIRGEDDRTVIMGNGVTVFVGSGSTVSDIRMEHFKVDTSYVHGAGAPNVSGAFYLNDRHFRNVEFDHMIFDNTGKVNFLALVTDPSGSTKSLRYLSVTNCKLSTRRMGVEVLAHETSFSIDVCKYITISNNVFTCNSATSSGSYPYGVSLSGRVSGALVDNNLFIGNFASGFDPCVGIEAAHGTRYVTMRDNQFSGHFGPRTAGGFISVSSLDNDNVKIELIIKGNRTIDHARQTGRVYLERTGEGMIFSDNHFKMDHYCYHSGADMGSSVSSSRDSIFENNSIDTNDNAAVELNGAQNVRIVGGRYRNTVHGSNIGTLSSYGTLSGGNEAFYAKIYKGTGGSHIATGGGGALAQMDCYNDGTRVRTGRFVTY